MDVNKELKFLRKFKKMGGGGWVEGGLGGQGRCKREVKFFVKNIKNKIVWGSVGGGGGSGWVGQDGCA